MAAVQDVPMLHDVRFVTLHKALHERMDSMDSMDSMDRGSLLSVLDCQEEETQSTREAHLDASSFAFSKISRISSF